MSSRVLVTGASGFLGRPIVEMLRDLDAVEVVSSTHDQLDLSDSGAVEALFSHGDFDILVHLAGRPRLGESPEAVATQWRDTFEVGRNVLTSAAANGVRHILAAGSMTELGNTGGYVGPEAAPAPVDTYGICKHLLLELSRHLVRVHGTRIDWFRPTAVYGPGQRGRMLIPSAFAAAMAQGSATFSAGTQQRDFIYVGDVARWVGLVVAASASLVPQQLSVHHLGTSRPVRVSDVLDAIGRLCGVSLDRGSAALRPGEPEVQSVPVYNTQSSSIVGWQAAVELTEGLRLTHEWWLTQIPPHQRFC